MAICFSIYSFLYGIIYVFCNTQIECFVDNKLVYSGPSIKVSTDSCGSATYIKISDSFMALRTTSEYISNKVVVIPKVKK